MEVLARFYISRHEYAKAAQVRQGGGDREAWEGPLNHLGEGLEQPGEGTCSSLRGALAHGAPPGMEHVLACI